MSIYAYKCRLCGTRADSMTRGDSLGPCPNCDGNLTRLFIITVERPMHEHFNPTVMKPISSNRQFDDELKRLSEERTLETGIEHKFVRHDHSDAKALGVTSEGLDESNKYRRANNLPELPMPKDA
jgi:hypothetical protein